MIVKAKPKAPRKTKDGPTPIDAHVGGRIRARRGLLGMSQKDLGEKVNLTFQQIQKYERGANRIGSGRLYEFSRILGVPISYFFEEMTADLQKYAESGAKKGKALPARSPDAEILDRRETLELIRAFYQVEDPMVRQRFLELMRETARVCAKK
ncbi:MAG: helix-turn-helix transcriptional regulator [Alphaproteobacteria bacterium]|nr:helix-turn-helix transcriptional regulator [Alphaproteobacteria bacterium]